MEQEIQNILATIRQHYKTENASIKVAVGVSGGVDSSIAAFILKEQGYDVCGVFMKNWEEDDDSDYCTAKDDLVDAEQVCAKLGIKLHKINFAAEYWDNVFEYFLEEYKNGRTPNPDILCNKEIKFKAFLDYALEDLQVDYIATGHYAKTRTTESGTNLVRAIDLNKDQTYFLCALNEYQLSKTFFPIGDFPKPLVRKLAAHLGLVTATKKDSTGICFIGERKFKDFLARYIPAEKGLIKTLQGDIIGKHDGLMYYTLGQRKGLGIGGLANYSEDPWYVISKDLSSKTLYVSQNLYEPDFLAQGSLIANLNWIGNDIPNSSYECTVKLRYRQQDIPCKLEFHEGLSKVYFVDPQAAVTPGQFAVFYQGDRCLGGGVINSII